ncbi:hypothetical protein CP49_37700 [Bradyrhizobium valentinum]|uniref:Uncharacterized protein n=1 Tax=Bradyrhizobium valentinum TaxID=1518501 RepID=A0A0R3L5Q9_9BRAD|nr:hypothetical protein CP49_37700 [Bradyrhizobium valentinum]
MDATFSEPMVRMPSRRVRYPSSGCGVAVDHAHRPAVEIGAAIGLESLDVPGLLVHPAADAERIGPVRGATDARDIVGARLVEAGIETGFDGILDREGVHAEQLVGMPEQRFDRAALVELGGGLHADVGAAAALNASVAGELAPPRRTTRTTHRGSPIKVLAASHSPIDSEAHNRP